MPNKTSFRKKSVRKPVKAVTATKKKSSNKTSTAKTKPGMKKAGKPVKAAKVSKVVSGRAEAAVQGFIQKEAKKQGEPFAPVKALQGGKRIR
jgi:hypothetical protein